MPDESCPSCGQEFDEVWGVTVGDSGDYQPVFGGPVALDTARCTNCNIGFKRVDGGPWLPLGGQ